MDITKSTSPTKSPESDTDTETPLQTHLTRALSFTNGSLKHCEGHYPPPPPLPPQQMVASYKECLKNHAASLGGLALDGCGEFMPSPAATPLDPTCLKCAACGCHRNFHRRDPYNNNNTGTAAAHLPPPPPPRPLTTVQWTSSPSPSPGPTGSGRSPNPSSPASPTPQTSFYPSAPHMFLALSTGQSGSLDEKHYQHPSFNPTVMNPNGRKRARTKFTTLQKEKMHAFAEKLGWRLLRGSDDDRMVEEFCSEVGVKRDVFKVWMHNNKHKREHGNGPHHNTSYGINGSEGRVSFHTKIYDNNNSSNYDGFNRYQIVSKDEVHCSTDGSSPSSSSRHKLIERETER